MMVQPKRYETSSQQRSLFHRPQRSRPKSIQLFHSSYCLKFGSLLFCYVFCHTLIPIPISYALQPPQQSSSPSSTTTTTTNTFNAVIPQRDNILPTSSDSNDAIMIIVSTKRNGGHTLRYNIMDSRIDRMTSKEPSTTSLVDDGTSAMMVDPSASASESSSPLLTQSILSFTKVRHYWTNVLLPSLSIVLQKDYWSSIYDRIRSGLRSTFLPIGYPHTVPHQYMNYVVWSSLQDLCTSVRSVIATQRVLQGIGVGTNTATTLSAIQNFLLRDAAGMFATLSFTSFTSGIFSKDIKRWRLFADCMVDIGITLEVLAVQLPKIYFVPMLCIANMCKALCGVAAGATSGSIALYWSSKANSDGSRSTTSIEEPVNRSNGKGIESTDISDINAKFGAQNTVVGSFGLIFSALFARSVATAPLSFVWMIYSMLTIFHIFANMQCMRIIAFPQFNTIRFNHVVASFFDQWFVIPRSIETPTTPSTNELDALQLPTPSDVAKIESLFFINNSVQLQQRYRFMNRSNALSNVTASILQRPRVIPIYFGVSFNEYIDRCATAVDIHQIKDLLLDSQEATQHPYFISIGSSTVPTGTITSKNCAIIIALLSNSSAYTQAQAYFHATLYRRIIEDAIAVASTATTSVINNDQAMLEIVEQKVREVFPLAWKSFVMECDKAGWDLSRTELHSKGYEIAYQQ